MSRLDDLPPDQRATLSLLLGKGKSYREVADLLGIDERVVHDRAHAALAVLAVAQARALTAPQREEVGDYLLGQRSGVAERLATRTYLSESPDASAWASALAGQLEPLAAAPLPEIPNGSRPAETPPVATEPATPRAGSPRSSRVGTAPRSSRVGGAVLLAAIVAGVVVAIVLIANGGSSPHKKASSSTSASSTSASTQGTAKEDRRITLRPTDPASHAIGVAEVISEGNKYAFYLAAEHLPPTHGFFYAVWLSSPTGFEALSKSPPVGSNGRLQGGALLPNDAGRFDKMLLTRETSNRPTRPGPVVLSGSFGLH